MTEQTTGQNASPDFIFGTLATTDDRVQSLIAGWRGLSEPTLHIADEAWTIRVTAGPDAPVNIVTVYYTLDGSDPQPGTADTLILKADQLTWNTLLWDYVQPFGGSLPTIPPESMLRYRVAGQTDSGQTIWSANGQRFSHFNATYSIPEWVRNAVIYQIFVDRFSTHGGLSFANHSNLSGFYGGTLRGITERLDYIADLGANVLWLSPIFCSPSHHGYDSTDYYEIEPRLGTKADLKALIDAAHARNIRILLDFIPNHISNEHPFFRSAASESDSPYRSYFTFTDWPHQYKTFFGVPTLPQINNDYPDARRYVIDSAVYWLREFGVDGFRLDYANGPRHDFWADFYAAVKQANPESFHVGEIVETPEFIRSYEGRMDGALDFHFLQKVRSTFAFDSMNVEQFDSWLHRHEAYFAAHNFILPTFVDNHDMNRFLWITRGDIQRLKLVALLQFTLPAPPVIYYGTEIGMSQQHDVRQGDRGILEESRLPMRWSEQNTDLLAYYQRLIALRHEIQSILQTARQTLLVDGPTGRYSYGYGDSNGQLLLAILLNNSPEPQQFTLNLAGTWKDLFTGNGFTADGKWSTHLPPRMGTILLKTRDSA